jgi:hypothetical protein
MDDIKNQLADISQRLDTMRVQETVAIFAEVLELMGESQNVMAQQLESIEQKIKEARIPDLHANIHILKQTLGLIARGIPTASHRPIRCLFLVHAAETWHALAGIYKAMCDAPDFEPIVATTHSRVTRSTDFTGEEHNHALLESAGVPHLRFNMPDYYIALDIIKTLAPDIIFRQMPWEGLMPPAFNTSELQFSRICYVPYGYLTVKQFTPDEPPESSASKLHTDQYFHRMCWRIFCETDMHKTMYEKYSVRQGNNVVTTGFTKFDSLLESRNQAPYWPIESKDGKKRFRIIWAPHHSISKEWIGLGTFVEIHNDMYGWALKHQDEYEFVFRPHPSLYGELTTIRNVMDKNYLDSYLAAWNALPNTATMDTGDYGPLFNASDAMITDGVSFFSEYQVFEKPLIFMDSGRHLGFNEAGSVVMESANNVKTVEQAKTLCDYLRSGMPDPMREMQKMVLKRIMPYPGQTAQRVLTAIREGLEKEYGTV